MRTFLGRIGLLLPDLETRRRQVEVMDRPDLDPGRHALALRALARVNRLSGTARRVWAVVRGIHLSRARTPDGSGSRRRPVRVLDVACGGGDVLRDVAALARRAGVPVDLEGCDVSPCALDVAGQSAPDLRFFRLDVRHDPLPDGYDLLCSSLFLHHLSDGEAVALLGRMKDVAAEAVLVEDLRRSRTGWALAWYGLRVLTRSDVARVDGPRSVEAAFRLDEVRAMCRRAGLDGAVVRRCWPQRFTLLWRAA